MAGELDQLDLRRHRDWEGRRYERWLPNLLFGLICLIPLFALLGVFGQTPHTTTATSPAGAATVELTAPNAVRSGLLFQARIDIRAPRGIKNAILVLDPGWLESMSLNTLEPSPTSESSRNGSLELTLGRIKAGALWRQYLDFQANPVNAGRQAQGLTLYDGKAPLLHISHDVMVWP